MSHWQFRPLNPNDNSGISTVEDNFANEERTTVEILVRETLQNPLDARRGTEEVEVCYNIVTLELGKSTVLDSLFSTSSMLHMTAGGLIPDAAPPSSVSFLTVEDFGTTGLEGCYADSSVDGPSENWNAFWFREGEGAKPTRSNGGAGQGKITLYAASQIRSVLALTRRASDGKELAFGCCRFRRNYKVAGVNERWAKEARWCSTENPALLAQPVTDTTLLAALKKELSLRRTERPGTSFIVPIPVNISLAELKKAVLNEFFFPIKRGRLTVRVGDDVIDKNSVSALSDQLGAGARYPADYRKFTEKVIAAHIGATPTALAKIAWTQTTKLSDSIFDETQLVVLKKQFEDGAIVSVDFPVRVRKKGHPPATGSFRVAVQQYVDGEQSHELFVRQDLGIDGEKRIRGSRRIQPVLSLTFIDDLNLSEFLVAAEEPTHRTWNASRPKVALLYDSPAPLMNAVRNASLRLVEFLTPAGVRDTTALSAFFAAPQSEPTKRKGPLSGPSDSFDGVPPVFPELKPAPPKPIELKTAANGFTVRTIPSADLARRLPLQCIVRTAYATTWGDPFRLWDAADFWLNESKDFPIEISGVTGLVRDGNEIRFRLDAPESSLRITGFDSNRKLEVQINYRENHDAEDIENH
jgi:hypothetical protein